MTIYTLYKKVDKLSGLHYLGMTTQDPYKYPGSGKLWKKHINSNITKIETTIIFQSTSKEEFNNIGRHYSRLWNIVNAMDDFGNKIWANVIPETGGGPGWGKGESNIIKNPEVKSKIVATKNSPQYKEKMSGDNNCMKNPEVVAKVMETQSIPENKNKFRQKMKEVNAREEVKAKKSEWAKNNNPMHNPDIRREWELKMKDPATWEKRQENYVPKKHGMYDHTLYEFVHTSGFTEKCQRYELQEKYNLSNSKLSLLVNGKRKVHKGWSIRK